VRFAIPPNDPRIAVLVAAADVDEMPAAEVWRRVGRAAERVGIRRPSYGHVRRLVRIERRRRELEREGRAVIGRAAVTLAAGRVPSAVLVLERLRELQRRGELVFQEHKPFGATGGPARGATAPGRRSRGP
jgi:hypothetical protein